MVSAIHADQVPGKWVECKNRVHSEFTTRSSNSSITVLPRILEKIPVMLFVGDQDLICNYVGVESMIQAMTWNGETGLGVSSLRLDMCAITNLVHICAYRKSRHSRGPSAATPRALGWPLVTSPT